MKTTPEERYRAQLDHFWHVNRREPTPQLKNVMWRIAKLPYKPGSKEFRKAWNKIHADPT